MRSAPGRSAIAPQTIESIMRLRKSRRASGSGAWMDKVGQGKTAEQAGVDEAPHSKIQPSGLESRPRDRDRPVSGPAGMTVQRSCASIETTSMRGSPAIVKPGLVGMRPKTRLGEVPRVYSHLRASQAFAIRARKAQSRRNPFFEAGRNGGPTGPAPSIPSSGRARAPQQR